MIKSNYYWDPNPTLWTVLFLLALISAISLTSCSKPECIGVWEKVESNEQEAQRQCVGLANDYPALSVVSDELITIDCQGYEEKNVVLTESSMPS